MGMTTRRGQKGHPTRAYLGGLVLLSLVLCSAVRADATDEAAREQLAALKVLCDQGLVSPEVCMEKQREILGLPPRVSGPPARGSAPAVRGSAPAAKRPNDAAGLDRPGKDARESGPAAMPPEGKDALPPGVRESSLGFRMHLPVGWVLIGQQEMRKGFALLAGKVAANPEAKRAWERFGDNAEVYLKDGEQITIQARAGTVPRDAASGQRLCQTLADSMAKLAGRQLTTYQCGPIEVAGLATFYVEHEALVGGMRTMQFWLEKEPGNMIQFTLNCKAENVGIRRQELKDIITSVRF